MKQFVAALSGALFLTTLMSPAQAALVAPQCGPTICYVWDDEQLAIDSLGDPMIAGDQAFFTPANFRAESANGTPAIDIESANFIFSKIYSHDGSEAEGSGLEIGLITVEESGDYRIDGGDSVDVTLRLQATNLASAEMTTVTEIFAATADTGGLSPEWELMAMIDPTVSFVEFANRINLGVQNTLTASTDADGEFAFIQKKFVLTVSTVVPVPAAVWLFASGLGLLGWLRRRSV